MSKKKEQLNEDVTEYFEGDPTSQRAYEVLSTQLTDEQLSNIDWEMVVMALQAKAAGMPVREHIEKHSYRQWIKMLDNDLRNMGY